ncbi:MAG: ATP:dephospho-CoA triphosphoribosyl transferase [Planctomycetaceae bacterium]|nr:ATP:dephospho-CoA triphosphoribosyl transferase [Planctomycetaceae bacterium]
MPQKNLKTCLFEACVLEARAKKPGNVHPEASFDDLTYSDFVESALAVQDTLLEPRNSGIGQLIFDAIQATQKRLRRKTNPNLGIVLLLAPLSAVPRQIPLQEGIEAILAGLTVQDANQVYSAIRLAHPGGLGKVDSADISDAPVISLRDAMRLAADRDSIASEYSTGFQIILQTAVPFLAEWPDFEHDWENAILHLQFLLMQRFPDTLIARKCGKEIADESAARAGQVLQLGGTKSEPGRAAARQLDAWLRADGHRRNPGTTADLIAASLFAAGRDGMINLSAAFQQSQHIET